MIKYIRILGLFLVLFALMAPSCNEEKWSDRDEEYLLDLKKDAYAGFESNNLSNASLYVFETKAKQQLADMADYFQILCDSNLLVSFREKAGEMIAHSFISKNVIVMLSDSVGIEEENNVACFLNRSLENKCLFSSFYFDSIQVKEHLSQVTDNMYKGRLQFLHNFDYSLNHSERRYSKYKETIFYLKKENKIFGADTLYVWNIRFGEINDD